MKFFNTAGPVKPEDHYFVSQRYDRSELDELIAMKKYFILHAPRQTGKTSLIMDYVKTLNKKGQYTALYINVEAAQAMRNQVGKGIRIIVDQIRLSMELTFGLEYQGLEWFQSWDQNAANENDLTRCLQWWAHNLKQPVCLFIDEIDSLIGDTLISVLRQLRAGYANRPEGFPQAVCLIGVRDVRDYRIWSEANQNMVLGGSAFNIKSDSLRLGDFNFEQTKDLLNQHTLETGQKFTAEAIAKIFYLTNGQPWLVNALAYEACFRKYKDRSITIEAAHIEASKEELIRRRDTHLDVLIDRLKELRIKNIIEPILLGDSFLENIAPDDIQYGLDLGLIAKRNNLIQIANPIYQEVLPREITWVTQQGMSFLNTWYQNTDGSLNMHKMLTAFQEFYRENAEQWLANFDYKESGPHLLMMAFLQRVINGGGSVHREYGLGRKRVDLLVKFQEQKFVIELKLLKSKNTLPEGLKQTRAYLDIAGTEEGHLLIFDRDMTKSWEDKLYQLEEIVEEKRIFVWGC